MTLSPREMEERKKALRAEIRRRYRWSGFELRPREALSPESGGPGAIRRKRSGKDDKN